LGSSLTVSVDKSGSEKPSVVEVIKRTQQRISRFISTREAVVKPGSFHSLFDKKGKVDTIGSGCRVIVSQLLKVGSIISAQGIRIGLRRVCRSLLCDGCLQDDCMLLEYRLIRSTFICRQHKDVRYLSKLSLPIEITVPASLQPIHR
jgi:hypothetical protein